MFTIVEPSVIAAGVTAVFVFFGGYIKSKYGREGSHFNRLEAMIARQEERIDHLELEIEELKIENSDLLRSLMKSEEYITLLRSHIINEKPPPPPDRDGYC